MNIQAIKEAALQIKDKLTKPPLSDILNEATSNENWNTPTKLLQEISEASFGYTQFDTIMKFIWKRIDSDNKEWRRILKTLNLIEYLIKNGAIRCVEDFRDSIFKIRNFSDFILMEKTSDKGLSRRIQSILLVREKSKQLVDLLLNEKLVEEEREKAKRIRERLPNAGGIGSIESNTNYQGYGRDTYKNDVQKRYGNDSQIYNISQNQLNGQNNNTKSDQQTYQQKYGILDEGDLDKYNKSQTKNNNNNSIQSNVPKTEVIQVPFQETNQKLEKPNQKWDVRAPKSFQQQPQQISQAKQNLQQQQQQQTQKQNIINIFDFEPQQNQQLEAPQIQTFQSPSSQIQNNNVWGSFDNVKPQTITQQQIQSLIPLDVFNQQTQQQQYIFVNQNQQKNQQQQQQQLYQQQQQSQPQQYYQLNQNQQINQNLYQQNYQQSLLINPNQQQYNFINNQQQYFQVNQQQQSNYNQQKNQQTKQEDQVFVEFIQAQQSKQSKNNQIDLLGMLDLNKEKQELESKKLIAVGNQQVQQNQIYPDIDTFTYNYQKKQQTFNQYPQGK